MVVLKCKNVGETSGVRRFGRVKGTRVVGLTPVERAANMVRYGSEFSLFL